MERKTTSFGMDRRTLVAGMAAVPALAFTQGALAQQNPVTAIDIALEPDATMVQHAKDANARLLKSFPKGFALDETHHPHVSVLQQFVRTDDLDKIFAAANAIMVKEKPTAWMLKAFKYYYTPRSAIRPRGNCGRTDRRPASAARRPHYGRQALHCEDRDPGGLLQRGRRTRHSKIAD
jgi:hypothetical protein